MAYEKVAGRLGVERGDVLAAVVASTIGNVHRDQKKQRSPYPLGDFMPQWEPRRTSWTDDYAFAKAMAAAGLGKFDERG